MGPSSFVFIKAAPKLATALSVKIITQLTTITAKGISDALVNANTLGLSDAFGNNHLDSYDDPYEKAAYLRGRVAGDILAIAQGGKEMLAGGGIALSTGIQTLGAGAAVGLVVGLHGAGIAATATSDATWAIRQLYKLISLPIAKLVRQIFKVRQNIRSQNQVFQVRKARKTSQVGLKVKDLFKLKMVKRLPRDLWIQNMGTAITKLV